MQLPRGKISDHGVTFARKRQPKAGWVVRSATEAGLIGAEQLRIEEHRCAYWASSASTAPPFLSVPPAA